MNSLSQTKTLHCLVLLFVKNEAQYLLEDRNYVSVIWINRNIQGTGKYFPLFEHCVEGIYSTVSYRRDMYYATYTLELEENSYKHEMRVWNENVGYTDCKFKYKTLEM